MSRNYKGGRVSIREVISLVNKMQADGVIDGYAIGGAVGATFFLEPISTLDIDIFVPFQASGPSLVINPQPIFDYLKARGGVMKGEYVVLEGWPVQFLPPNGPLVEEALRVAVTMDVDGVPAKVFSAEHLAAVALQTGRPKDKARLLQFIESGVLDRSSFHEIINRHGLASAWSLFKKNFLDDQV